MIGVAGVKRWEEERDQVNVYFEELSTRRECVGFLVVQETQVENPLPAIIRMYDYYQQELSVSAVSSFCLPFLTLNLLKPTAHVMHQQFNIQQLYALPTLYLCVLYLSENKQRLVRLTA